MKPRLLLLGLLAATARLAAADPAPAFTDYDLARSRAMLRQARDAVVEYFYDATRVGDDFQARVRAAEEALGRARSNAEAQMIIAQVFLDVGDSHTLFLAPARRDRVEHGWKFHAVGPHVYVSEVERGSDAEKQGLRVGDRLHAVDGLALNRERRYLASYLLYTLAPRAGMRVIAQAPGAEPRQLDIKGEVRVGGPVRDLQNARDYYEAVLESENRDARRRSRFAELPGGLLVWKLSVFDREKVGAGIRRAAGAKTVVLDLRGNPGGAVWAATDLLEAFFRDDFDVATLQERKKTEPFHIKGKGTFQGLLIVLIDNASASSSEIFAKTVQMRQRGILVGDRTAGALSTAKRHVLTYGNAERFTPFGVMITHSGVTMADGTVIEGRGVTPDVTVIPTHEQLYHGHDAALAKALEVAGHPLTPEAAGRLFPALD